MRDESRSGSGARRRTGLRAALLALACAGCAEPPAPGTQPPPTLAAAPDTVEFASGPLTLRGLVYRPAGPGPHPAVLFLHGIGDDYHAQVADAGPLYARNGYRAALPLFPPTLRRT